MKMVIFMKKILVLSDSHRNNTPMTLAVQKENPDMIIHLGDHIDDAAELSMQFPRIPMVAVPGNCDFSSEPGTRLLTIDGYRIFLCHGHQYHVKQSLLSLTYAAREKKADAVLFGHTHLIHCDYHNGLVILNPGSIGFPNTSSYGLLFIDENGLRTDTKTLK